MCITFGAPASDPRGVQRFYAAPLFWNFWIAETLQHAQHEVGLPGTQMQKLPLHQFLLSKVNRENLVELCCRHKLLQQTCGQ